MLTDEACDIDHRAHPFALPSVGTEIISPETGISYLIGEPLSSGGFGTVFHCIDCWGDELVAKILRPVGDNVEMETRATSEVVAGAIARSRHIVHVADTFLFKGAYYIISEYCDLSVHDMMSNPVFDRRVWFPSLLKAVLHGLHFMHTRGLVHCDVHPGNVLAHRKPCCLLGDDSAACDFKLGDFGQTRPVSAVKLGSTWNNGCIPPEILKPDEFGVADHRADLYQAGMLFLKFLHPATLDFDHDDVLSGRPRECAEALPHAAAEPIALMLRRHVDARPITALAAWHNFEAAHLLQH